MALKCMPRETAGQQQSLGTRNLQPHPYLPLNKTSSALTFREEFIIDLHAIEVPTETTGVVLEPAVQLHLLEEKGGLVSRPQSPAHFPEPLSLDSFQTGQVGKKKGGLQGGVPKCSL